MVDPEFIQRIEKNVVEIEGYCQSPQCMARRIWMEIKDHAEDLPLSLHCPLCQTKLKVHHVFNREEKEDSEWNKAVLTVAFELIETRERRRFGLAPGVPAAVNLLEVKEEAKRLPRELGIDRPYKD